MSLAGPGEQPHEQEEVAMARGRSGSSAALKAARTATTRTASGGAMASAAGIRVEEARKAAEALTPLEVAALPRLSLRRIGPHPLNPEHRHMSEAELTELAADIARRGVLVPALVATREKILSYDPTMADLIPPEHEVVLIDGHRRWGASNLAGVEDMPYLLRDDLADPADAAEVFLSSNIHSLKLSPIEEAEGYQRLMKYGKVKQADLAARVGVSQSRVSKALQLLKLPTAVQKAVAAATISPHAARRLLDLPDSQREAVYLQAIDQLDAADRERPEQVAEAVRVAVNRALAEAEKAAAAATARAALQAADLAEIDPKELFGSDYWKHELRDNEVDVVREAGELAGAVVHDSGRTTYYSTSIAPRHRVDPSADTYSNGISDTPGDRDDESYSNGISDGAGEGSAPENSNGISDPSASTADEHPTPARGLGPAEVEQALQAAAAAHAERIDAMRRLVTTADAATITDVLADAVLAAHWIEWSDADEFTELAGLDTSPKAIETLLLTGARPDVHRTALAAALGALEAEAARAQYATNGPWPTPIQRHVRRLHTLGLHTLTDYDRAHLTETE
ncbi:ParB/RepB/Spo0J family partition protein [Nocardia farcinica]|uniref:ParB/RepB/Spo0J family partition protein n=1 Tax=Nocardia farcinica TaxID=37329 RepID=UPI002458A8AC|nr:ParB/RepB/Spo0J family partition protein [Nocardia farcinica]